MAQSGIVAALHPTMPIDETTPPPPETAATPGLARGLGAWDATAIAFGSVVGTGIFLVPSVLARELPSAGWILVAWLAGGALTLAGALSYAELGAMFPRAGGIYVFLREAWGPLWGFLYGWTSFTVIFSGAIAAIAVGFGEYLGGVLPWFRSDHLLASTAIGSWRWTLNGAQVGGVVAIVGLTAIHHLGLRAGARLVNSLTVAKLVALGAFALGAWIVAAPATGEPQAADAMVAPGGSGLLAGFGLAMIAVLWTYDGWYCLTFAAGELREPARTLPIGLVAGNLLVVALYLVVQLAYFRALPLEILAATPRTGEAAALALFGAAGGRAITLAILITILGCLAGTILTSSRIYLAMAADGLFFAALARVDPRRRIPARALWAQSLWAVALALSGTFERLYTWVVFTGLLLHLAAAAGVFALRRRRPEQARPFRVPLWPWPTVAFLVALALLAANTFVARPAEAAVGIALTAAGLPAYLLWRRKAGSREPEGEPVRSGP